MKHAQDHFSAIASQYVRGRIGYPNELYQFLFAQCPRHELAWHCATGTGQAAQDLARKFHQVIATDISTELIQLATPHPRITYRVASAEDSGLDTESVV
jgi:ubiquinone/menaquinone biosynthesis C-methylase UbiE